MTRERAMIAGQADALRAEAEQKQIAKEALVRAMHDLKQSLTPEQFQDCDLVHSVAWLCIRELARDVAELMMEAANVEVDGCP